MLQADITGRKQTSTLGIVKVMYLESGLVLAVALLVEEDLLPRDKRLLQRSSDAHGLHGALELQRHGRVLQARCCELVGLGDERILEPVVVVLGHLAANTRAVVDVDQVERRLRVHGQLALRTDDLGSIFLAGSHHARGIEVGDFAIVELDEADCVVTVVVLAKIRLHSRDTHGRHGLDLAVLAEEPQGEINVVDRAVHKDSAGKFGVGDEEAGRIELVAGLTPHDGGGADSAGRHFCERISVGGIETTGETAHHLEVRFLGGGIQDGLRLLKPIH